jgi:hypothetical protein
VPVASLAFLFLCSVKIAQLIKGCSVTTAAHRHGAIKELSNGGSNINVYHAHALLGEIREKDTI